MKKTTKNILAIIVIIIMCAWIYNTIQQVDKISGVTPEMREAKAAEHAAKKAHEEAVKANPMLATQYVYDVRFEHPYGVAGRLTKRWEMANDLDNCNLVLTDPETGKHTKVDLRNIIRIGDAHLSAWHTNVLTNKGKWMIMSWYEISENLDQAQRIVSCNRNVKIG